MAKNKKAKKELSDKDIKQGLIGLVGLAVLIFMLSMCSSDDGSTPATETVAETEKVKTIEPEKEEILGGKSKNDLFQECKAMIESQLSHPKSMDASILSLTLGDVENGQHVMWFDFEAKNDFGAELQYTAKCLFATGNGALQSGEIVK